MNKSHRNKKSNSILNLSKQKGMTLVELMVVLAIFIIVAGITMFDYGRFRSSVSLDNLADDISLSIRKAQSYAIGAHNSVGYSSAKCFNAQSSTFCSGYGIHISTATPTGSSNIISGSNKSFVMFNDINRNNIYNLPTSSTCDSSGECSDIINITSNDIIDKISDGSTNCSGNNCYVDITFVRPNPDASIEFMNGSNLSSPSSINIYVKNVQSSKTKIITVSNTGQISVQ